MRIVKKNKRTETKGFNLDPPKQENLFSKKRFNLREKKNLNLEIAERRREIKEESKRGGEARMRKVMV